VSSAASTRRRLRLGTPLALGLAALATIALLVAALALTGSRSGERGGAAAADSSGPLVWNGKPRIYGAPGMPRDRVLTGVVRNDSVRVAEVEARDIAVFAEDGDRLKSAAIFLGSFSRGLYAGSRLDQASDIERRRTGRLLRIGPGGEQPLTVSWRTLPGGERAERIEYGSGSLPVP
jgi:hypothetical protein